MNVLWAASSSAVGAWGRGGRKVLLACVLPRGFGLAAGAGLERKARLAAAGQVQIDLGQQTAIYQRAMQRAFRLVDLEPRAERIQAVRSPREAPARHLQRIDQPFPGDRREAQTGEFSVEEPRIERRIVDHQRRIADKLQEPFHDFRETRLVRQEFLRQFMDPVCVGRHVALGIDVAVPDLAGRHAVDQFQRADLHDPVPLGRLQPRRLGIEDDLTHVPCLPCPAAAALYAANVSNGGVGTAGAAWRSAGRASAAGRPRSAPRHRPACASRHRASASPVRIPGAPA